MSPERKMEMERQLIYANLQVLIIQLQIQELYFTHSDLKLTKEQTKEQTESPHYKIKIKTSYNIRLHTKEYLNKQSTSKLEADAFGFTGTWVKALILPDGSTV